MSHPDRSQAAFHFRTVRLAILLTTLASVAFWGWKTVRERNRRTLWERPLFIGVTLLSTTPLDDNETAQWNEGLTTLQNWLTSEAERYGMHLQSPFLVDLVGTATVSETNFPAASPETASQIDRISYMLRLKEQLRQVDLQAVATRSYDIRLYVALHDAVANRVAQVEGIAEAGGEVGLVHADRNDDELGLELVAMAHEILHCLGATDRYDSNGHAIDAASLANPSQDPLFPQEAAEVMVGELSLGRSLGRSPSSLNEVRVGPMTATAIRWIAKPSVDRAER